MEQGWCSSFLIGSFMSQPAKPPFEDNRRDFIRGSSLLLAGAIPGSRRDAKTVASQTSELRVGLIGCGYRGISLASQVLGEFQGRAKLTAVADVFPDRMQQAVRSLKGKHPDLLSIDDGKRFAGLDGYQRLLESNVDFVLLATPPAFRPLHVEAAVAARKHVYAERPVATDAPGVRRFQAALEVAKQHRLLVMGGFQRRLEPAYRETLQRLQQGAIGRIVFARVYCNVPARKPAVRRAAQSELEFQLRNWPHFQWASGDCIVEQHVQNLDVINWLVGDHPVEAQGSGGVQARERDELGDVFDHHTVEYSYRGGLRLLSMCRQASGCWSTVSEWAHGTEGWCDISSGKIYDLNNRLQWRAGDCPPAGLPAANRFAAFASQDRASLNPGSEDYRSAEHAAESTMTAIMGRMATYSGKLVRWDECLASQHSLANVEDLHTMSDPAPVLPLPSGRYALPAETPDRGETA
jgi:myo-inositol 2-dehydrogenase/D-chiro-inositol 1-dehydrogenase